MLSQVGAAVAGVLLVSGVAHADDGAPPESPLLKIAGYIEAYYQYNVAQPSNLTTAYRAFDDRSNSFTIQNAVLDVAGAMGKISTHIVLQIGSTPASYYATEPVYPAQAGTGANDSELWRLIQQALIGYQAREELLVDAGIFLSPIGLENLPVKDQWNWSRSDLFFALPSYHAGVRATYEVSSRVRAVAMVTNGWNDIVNRNRYPCVAGSVAYDSGDGFTASGLYFGGVEPPTGSPEGQPWRNLFDATAAWAALRSLSFAAQADAGWEDNHFGRASWLDGAAYARLRVVSSSRVFLAARYDVIHEHEPAGSARLFFPADTVQSGTLTLDVRPEPTLSVRLEYRHDHASSPLYFSGTVAQDASGADIPTAHVQDTVTLGAVGWF